jgi:hypothetical protein
MKNRIIFKLLFAIFMMPSLVLHASSFDDFFIAVKQDNVAAIRQLAQRGFDLNTRCSCPSATTRRRSPATCWGRTRWMWRLARPKVRAR